MKRHPKNHQGKKLQAKSSNTQSSRTRSLRETKAYPANQHTASNALRTLLNAPLTIIPSRKLKVD